MNQRLFEVRTFSIDYQQITYSRVHLEETFFFWRVRKFSFKFVTILNDPKCFSGAKVFLSIG